jgi:hypothetical protein
MRDHVRSYIGRFRPTKVPEGGWIFEDFFRRSLTVGDPRRDDDQLTEVESDDS